MSLFTGTLPILRFKPIVSSPRPNFQKAGISSSKVSQDPPEQTEHKVLSVRKVKSVLPDLREIQVLPARKVTSALKVLMALKA
jgi:hypothetical protein